MNKVIVVVGPTGIGKTKMSIELAKKYNGEIINADSMQIYKELNIGTNKIKESEKQNITHHLFDIKNVEEEYSIYNYQIDCRNKINEILKRKKTPILVGGTGLYIKSALYNYQLNCQPQNNDYPQLTTEELYQKLIALDKEAINKIDPNNRRRIVNAINYFKNNQTSITSNKTNQLLYNVEFIGLTTSRDKLYNIINNRVDLMFKNGLLEEVLKFYNHNIQTKPLTGGIGYKELYEYFNHSISLEEAIEKIKRNSRKYAKRQYTFFYNQLPVTWFNVDYNNFFNTVKEVINYLDNTNDL